MIQLKSKKYVNKKKTDTNDLLIYSRPYTFFKPDYNSVVPRDIYQTWFTKDLPPKMRERVETLKRQNPRFNHYLYDDNDCREFIQTNFKSDVLEAYDRLIPGAYKADLWRLCILFINGGIYLDIKLNCINGFKLIELTESEHFVLDRPPKTIYNALMACKKGNVFLYKCIRKIVENVKTGFYGDSPLHPTGPGLLGSVILNNGLNINIDILHYEGGGLLIYKNRFIISTEYNGYNAERSALYNNNNTQRYDKLWESKTIYK
jgi:mannosyltransferase OCH1-like enzyme